MRWISDMIGGRSRARTYEPLIKSQLLYHLSYAPDRTRLMNLGARGKCAPLNTALRALSSRRERCAYQRSPSSSRRMRKERLTWALSTKPKPTIMVRIEVPP